MSERVASTKVGALACALTLVCTAANAVDIRGVENAALDQPQIEVTTWLDPLKPPLSAGLDPISGTEITSFTAFLDTGASGIVISEATANAFQIPRALSNGQLITHSDVGVAGAALFNVSVPLNFHFSTMPPLLDPNPPPAPRAVSTLDDARAEIGPLPTQAGTVVDPLDLDDLLNTFTDFNIIGMPAMRNKVVVLDPKPLDNLSGMRSYIYNPLTPFDAGTADTDPGIPAVSHSVKLSFVSFDDASLTLPAGAPGPTFAANPMIGANRLTGPQDQSPGVTITYKGAQTTGSFLLDTGAQSSFISTAMAAQLGISMNVDANGQPHLIWTDASNAEVDITETVLPVTGIGGTTLAPGFRLSSLLLHTVQGDPNNNEDPNHLRFLDAPVFVNDISVVDPTNSASIFTLDGVLGMNFFVASLFVDLANFSFGPISPGAFNWLVLDMATGRLGLDLKAAPVPLPPSLLLFFPALTIVLCVGGKRPRTAGTS